MFDYKHSYKYENKLLALYVVLYLVVLCSVYPQVPICLGYSEKKRSLYTFFFYSRLWYSGNNMVPPSSSQ